MPRPGFGFYLGYQMPPVTILLVLLGIGLLVLLFAGRRSREDRPMGRNVVETMREFGRRHPDFLSQLVRENEIQNVILYRFIDGYREEGGYRAAASQAEEKRLMRAARTVIKELLAEPPLGSGEVAETLGEALDAWRREENE